MTAYWCSPHGFICKGTVHPKMNVHFLWNKKKRRYFEKCFFVCLSLHVKSIVSNMFGFQYSSQYLLHGSQKILSHTGLEQHEGE